MSTLVEILFAVLFVLFAAGWWTHRMLTRRLQARYPELCARLKADRGISRELWHFLWHRGYDKLRDPQIARLAEVMRIAIPVYIMCFIGLAVLILREDREPPPRAPEFTPPAATAPAAPAAAPAGDSPALVEARRVILQEPGNRDAHIAVDRILTRERRWDEILQIWDAYLARSPNDAVALYERSGTHYHAGNAAASRADLLKACELGLAEACARARKLGIQ